MNSKTILALAIVAMVVLCTVEGHRLDKAAKKATTKARMQTWLMQKLGKAKQNCVQEREPGSSESSDDSTSSESAGSLNSLEEELEEIEELLENVLGGGDDDDGDQGTTRPW